VKRELVCTVVLVALAAVAVHSAVASRRSMALAITGLTVTVGQTESGVERAMGPPETVVRSADALRTAPYDRFTPPNRATDGRVLVYALPPGKLYVYLDAGGIVTFVQYAPPVGSRPPALGAVR
jgi:hypothetical protein